MKVKLAKSAGFCMGVRRAMEIVLAEVNKNNTSSIYTFGPLIHNSQVLELLESKGVKVLEDMGQARGGKVIIRAHGIPPQTRGMLRESGAEIIDATCPKVARVQAIIRYYTNKGYQGIIVGDADHPEVIGLKGYGGDRAHVVSGESDLSHLPRDKRLFVVAQTTQNARRYEAIVRKIKESRPDAIIFDTICDATHQRQEEVKTLAQQVDAIVVVGGFHSGNTQRLTEIARSTGKPAFHVETPKDLKPHQLQKMDTVGVTAGASTPNWLIKEVVREIERIKGKRDTLLTRFLNRAVKSVVLSNLAAAAGACSLSYAANRLLDIPSSIFYPAITFLYIYAMHVLNRFLDRTASAYNEPERAAFLRSHGKALAVVGGLSTLCAMVLSLKIGVKTFLALLLISVLGILYSMPIVPKGLLPWGRYTKIKDIPGSKTLSEALAWAAVIVFIPLLNGYGSPAEAVIPVGLAVFLLAYIRAALFDIFQIQGDLIAGSETLPIVLGEKRTLSLLKALVIMTAMLFVLGGILHILGPLSYLMLIPVVTLALCLLAYARGWLLPGIAFEALVEANFLLFGLLAAAWVNL